MSSRLGLIRIIGSEEWLATTDGGRTWSVRESTGQALDPEDLERWAYPAAFTSPASGWMVGGHSIWRYGLGAKQPTIELLEGPIE